MKTTTLICIFSFISFITKAELLNIVHTARWHNTNGYSTIIDHPAVNENPDVVIIATPYCEEFCQQYFSPIGVHFDGTHWSLFREDLRPIDEYQKFSIVVKKNILPNVFIHEVTPENTFQNLSILDHPLLNEQPEAILFVTHRREVDDPFNNASIIIYYSKTLRKWCLVNSDQKPLVANHKFNILINPNYSFSLPISLENANGENYYAILNKIDQKWIDKIVLVQAHQLKSSCLFGIKNNSFFPTLCTAQNTHIPPSTVINLCVKTVE